MADAFDRLADPFLYRDRSSSGFTSFYSSRGNEVVKQLQVQLAERRKRRAKDQQPGNRQFQTPGVRDLLSQAAPTGFYSMGR